MTQDIESLKDELNALMINHSKLHKRYNELRDEYEIAVKILIKLLNKV